MCDKISQSEFARTLGVSRSHLCDVEKGRKVVSPEHEAVVVSAGPDLAFDIEDDFEASKF